MINQKLKRNKFLFLFLYKNEYNSNNFFLYNQLLKREEKGEDDN